MDLDEFIALIRKSTNHRHLYHFADESNFSSINELGLLSKAQMECSGVKPHAAGGNDLSWILDKRKGIWDDVSLCFTQSHPMKFVCQHDGRLPNPRYLAIDPDVLRIEGVRVAFGIANANETTILPIQEALATIDVEVIYSRTNWSDREIQQRLRDAERCEILVPQNVPRPLILGFV